MNFEEFFEELVKRNEFAEAFHQVGPAEREGVKDVAKIMFRQYEVGKRDLASQYIDVVCKLVSKEGSCGSIRVMETAFCNAGSYLPRKYSMVANA